MSLLVNEGKLEPDILSKCRCCTEIN
ncbi:hypothetical protein ACLK19_27355 [Escherichia coli]